MIASGVIAATLLLLAGAHPPRRVAPAAGGTASSPETGRSKPTPTPGSTPAALRELQDEIGRTVRVVAKPARIVSLAPAITESLFAVGAGAQVVGVTRYCNYPPEAATRTKVGGFADPDVERVVSLSPDLVLATADTVTRDRFDGIVKLGLPVYVVNPRDLAGVAAMLRHVGEASGHAVEAEARAREFEAAVAATDARMVGMARVRALFLFSVDPPIAAGPSTFVDELLRHAGAENVAARALSSYPRYAVEGILAAAPSVVFTTVPGGTEALKKMLAGSAVAKSGQIVEVDADLLERPGPRLADGLARIASLLHPPSAVPPPPAKDSK